jgi:outer membrane protein assembly factor BamB
MFNLESLAYSSENCSVFKMPRQLVVSLTIFIIILFTVSGLTAFQTQHQPSVLLQVTSDSISQPEVLYQKDIKHFATACTVAEGKLFITDYEYNLICFDAQTGRRLWSNEGFSGIFTVQDGILYVGSSGGIVKTVDINTGKLLPLQFQAIVDTSWGSKSPPTACTVVDGRIFVEQSGWRAYNVSTGELLWESLSPSHTNLPGMPYTEDVWAFENNLVIAYGIYPSGSVFHRGVYRINPDTGTLMWSISGFTDNNPLLYNDRVIFWNYNKTDTDTGQTVISVDASTGDILWNIDLKTMIYQPVICQDKFLFVTTDGHFGALGLSKGSLIWNTQLTSEPIFLGALSLQVDSQTQRIFWGYLTTIQNNENTNNCRYDGNLYSLNSTTGNIIWTSPFSADIIFFTNPSWQPDIAVLNSTVFLSTFGDLWEFSKSTGTILGTKNFEHYISIIVSAYNKVFVVADLYVIAYNDYSDSTITGSHSWPKVYQQIIVPVVVGVIVALLFLVYRKYRNKHNIV